ncbi:4-(cytidine 5'-diphospho)-2-C-methyl-D-erythritol kinase [Cysteiniphilum halobium]|uniref:4-(cytidine 5'-diphospho)-2-C-methyl-D-erythritol kinase n=1 Tax=Cysteiniphilum halobium TaxID=2219059 RepID=UPI000E64AD93|nr:4-(cytidine 5'-diphospho)-2-C-methyl-D-erythritol kinase [Cysteiniphilum halobium]
MAFEPITYPSYAKINLFLHITGKRDDGYHNLQTWFQFIDLKDFLHFSATADNQIKLSSNVNIGKDEDNLIYKAALALKPFAKGHAGIDVHIDKNIPMGAGLGGGSSNAATTLIALNTLWQCHLSNKQLHGIGCSLGADVPIFLLQKAAWAEGIGEMLIPKPYIEQYALIIKPDFHASTTALFNHALLNKNKSILNHQEITDPLPYDNVFLEVIQSLYSKVWLNLQKLPSAKALRLTGTGACFYLLSTDYNHLLQNQKKLEKDIDSWIVKTLNFAPVER